MDEIYDYRKRYWYPHMKPADITIWERFVDKYPDVYKAVSYDVAVGTGAAIPPGVEASIARGFKTLTQRKIDVVALDGNKVDIIELKPAAGTSAIGQVLGYVELFKRDQPTAEAVRPVLITDSIDADAQHVADKLGVTVIIV